MEIEINVDSAGTTEKYTVRSFEYIDLKEKKFKLLVIANDNPDTQLVCVFENNRWVQRTGSSFTSDRLDLLYDKLQETGIEILTDDALPEMDIDKVYFEEQERLLAIGMNKESIFTGKPAIDPQILIRLSKEKGQE